MEGFYQTVEELGKIPDVSERAQASMKVFGRSGMEFAPLINKANEGTGALRNVIAAMPKVAQAAADVGDNLSDAKTIGANAFKSLMLNSIGAVCNLFNVDFRGAAMSASAYVDYAAHVSWRYMKSFFDGTENGLQRGSRLWEVFKFSAIRNCFILSATCFEYIKTIPRRFVAGVAGGLFAPFTLISDKFKNLHNRVMKEWIEDIHNGMWKKIDNDLKEFCVDLNWTISDGLKDVFKDVDTSDLEAKLKKALDVAKIAAKDYGGAAGSLPIDRGGLQGSDLAGSKSHNRPQNDLIIGGSNDMLKLAKLGPNLQEVELKKQTAILEKIAENTKSVSDNTESLNEEGFVTVN